MDQLAWGKWFVVKFWIGCDIQRLAASNHRLFCKSCHGRFIWPVVTPPPYLVWDRVILRRWEALYVRYLRRPMLVSILRSVNMFTVVEIWVFFLHMKKVMPCLRLSELNWIKWHKPGDLLWDHDSWVGQDPQFLIPGAVPGVHLEGVLSPGSHLSLSVTWGHGQSCERVQVRVYV